MSKIDINVEAIRILSDLLEKSSLSEIEYAVENVRIKVARNISQITNNQQLHQQTLPNEKNSSCENKKNDEKGLVRAQMVGTVYLAASPTSKNYVSVGTKIKKGDVLCIIEAMKVLNYIKSTSDGVISRILVENSQPVEYGEGLFVVTEDKREKF